MALAIREQNFEKAAMLRDAEGDFRRQLEEGRRRFLAGQQDRKVGEGDIRAVLEQWTGVPVSAPDQADREALAVCAHVTLSYEKNGVRMLFMLVPAWAALALVYYLYQPECFLAVTAGGFGAMGLWFVRFGGMTVDVALCLVGAVLVALVTLGLKKSDGALMQAGGKKVQWAPQGISYALVLASCVLGVLVVIAAAALGSNAAYYLMFAMVAWLFALVVYYTVKMM